MGHAHANLNNQFMPSHLHGSRKVLAHGIGNVQGGLSAWHIRQQDCKLVTTNARHKPSGVRGEIDEALGDFNKDLVPSRMAQCIVNFLERTKID